jgi:hypothetical protein
MTTSGSKMVRSDGGSEIGRPEPDYDDIRIHVPFVRH